MPRYATTRPEGRTLPWDAMGGALSTKAKTVTAALEESGLDYDVEVRQAISGHAHRPDGSGLNARTKHTAPKHQALVRPMPDGSEMVLAFTKKRYTPIQNRDAFSVADYLVKEFGAKVIGAADFRDGARSLLVVDLAQPVKLVQPDGGVDQVDLDLIISNDHAGNAALTMALTPMRFSCTNALPAAMKNAERVWKVSHTPKAQTRLDLAAEAVLKAVDYRDAFQAQAQAMMDQAMVDAEFQKMVAKLYPVKSSDEGVKAERRRETQAQLLDMWHHSPTIQGIKGTRWAGFNVVTEWLDHFRPVRGEESVARAEGALDGPYVRQKAALWGMFAAA